MNGSKLSPLDIFLPVIKKTDQPMTCQFSYLVCLPLNAVLTENILFSRSADVHCLGEILKRLAGDDIAQKRNALDVVSEIINISSDSSRLSHSVWYATYYNF